MKKNPNELKRTANTPPWVEAQYESMPLGRSKYLLGGDGPKTAGDLSQYRSLRGGSLVVMPEILRASEIVRTLEQYKGTEIWDTLEALGKTSKLRVRRYDGLGAINAAASLLAAEEKDTGKTPESKLFSEVERILNSHQGSFKYASQEMHTSYYPSRGGRW